MKRTFTIDELASELDVSKATIQNWRRQGLPASKGKARNAALKFDRLEAASWFSQKGWAKYVYALAPKTDELGEQDAPASDEDSGIQQILTRLRGIEQYLYKQYQSASDNLKGWFLEQHRASAEQLRKWEKEWATIQYSQGTVISKEQHESEMREMCMSVRNALLNLANKSAPLCAHKDERQVMKIIREEVMDCMRDLSEVKDS